MLRPTFIFYGYFLTISTIVPCELFAFTSNLHVITNSLALLEAVV